MKWTERFSYVLRNGVYKTALFGLCGWTVFNIYQSITKGIELEMLPCLILCLSISVQGFTQIAIKTENG